MWLPIGRRGWRARSKQQLTGRSTGHKHLANQLQILSVYKLCVVISDAYLIYFFQARRGPLHRGKLHFLPSCGDRVHIHWPQQRGLPAAPPVTLGNPPNWRHDRLVEAIFPHPEQYWANSTWLGVKYPAIVKRVFVYFTAEICMHTEVPFCSARISGLTCYVVFSISRGNFSNTKKNQKRRPIARP